MTLNAIATDKCQINIADKISYELRTPNTVQYIARMIGELGDKDREELIVCILPSLFCVHCGIEDPRCQCWNDE